LTIPTNYEIATGRERFEFMKTLKGENPFEDMTPIKLTHKGTKENPINVAGVDPVFYVGCSGNGVFFRV
jgi:cytochrome c oxidase subunit 5b